MKTFSILGAIGIATLCLNGCTQTEQGAAGGALAGGALGGIIGHQSGEAVAGAAIGAAGGAVVGGLIGHSMDERDARSGEPAQPASRVQPCPQGHDVDVSGYAPGSQVRCPIDNSIFTVQ